MVWLQQTGFLYQAHSLISGPLSQKAIVKGSIMLVRIQMLDVVPTQNIGSHGLLLDSNTIERYCPLREITRVG